jgi:hypothetical protein
MQHARQTFEVQTSLSGVAKWASTWQLRLNADKCAVVHMGFGAENPQIDYFLDGKMLSVSKCETDLGIFMSDNIYFSEHCHRIAARASQRSGLIRHAFSLKNAEFRARMFCTYVRPILEYGSEIFNPHQLKDIAVLENVQRSYTRKIPALRGMNYRERLTATNLEPLELRRLKSDLIMVYKIWKGLVDLRFDEFFEFRNNHNFRGDREHKLYPKFRRSVRAFWSFANRCINPWNSLPLVAVQSTSLAAFKRHLDSPVVKEILMSKFIWGRAIT